MSDPYTVLGVARDASADDIRKAYKKLARKHHPDVAKTEADASRFTEINAAYDVVGDEDKRKLFDDFGEASTRPGFDADRARAWKQQGFGGGGFDGQRGTPGGGFRWSSDGPDFSGGYGGSPDDILGGLFGGRGRGRGRGPIKGQDITAEVHVSLRDVARNEPIELSLRRPARSDESGTPTLVLQEQSLKVRLPPAVEDGRTIRLRGKGGDSLHGGPAGDLLLTVRIDPSPGLRREGDVLELDLPITFAEALSGGRVTVPTFEGEVKLTIPPCPSPEQRLRLRGKGMKLAEGRGDLLVVLRPVAPRAAGPEAEALTAQLAALYEEDVRASVSN